MVEDTLKGLELGAVETLIVWEGLETMRCVGGGVCLGAWVRGCGRVWLQGHSD